MGVLAKPELCRSSEEETKEKGKGRERKGRRETEKN